jgi:myosin-crossreactive antigen
MNTNTEDAHVWMVGGGIARMVATAFLLRDVAAGK